VKRHAAVLAAILAAVLALMAALAATSATRASAATEPLRVVAVDVDAAPAVTLTVAVPGSLADRPLADANFEVRESGTKRPARVTGLPSDPLDVVLVIDTSGSMRGAPLDSAKAAAQAFLAEMPAPVRIAIVGFGDRPYRAMDFTADRGALAAAIANLQAAGETALYDAVGDGLALLTGSARHALVVLSDGKDTSSQATVEVIGGALAATKLSFHGVALQSPEADLSGLDRLAAAAGGSVVPASDPVQLSDAYRAIGAELSSQYRVTFPTTGSGSTGFVVTVRDGEVSARGSARASLPAGGEPLPAPVRVRAETAPDPGFFSQGWVLAVGLVALFLGLLAAVALVAVPREGRSQISTGRRVRTGGSRITALADQATNLAERSLERSGKRPGLDTALEQAGIAMRPAEFVVLVAAIAFAIFVAGLLLTNVLAGIVLAGAALFGCRFLLQHLARRRRHKFGDQLEQTLPLMASSLRAGFGLLQAVDAVARESEAPTAEEFRRLVTEAHLGRDLADSLAALADRVRNEDFSWVVQAIEIHRQVGGDLAEVLDNVSATIRDRNRIRRQIDALSGEGRLSAVILFLLPLGMIAVLQVVNPGYLSELTTSGLGQALIVVAGGLMLAGGIWLRRLTRLVF
jgi:tight adherence protein B